MAGSFIASAGPRETCDGVDTNGDGYDAPAWFPDADGDRFGRAVGRIFRCARPIGYASRAGDCDDGDATSYPGGTEMCDSADNDCDGETDEADGNPDAVTHWDDDDGDGYGDDSAGSWTSCDADGFAEVGGDCDDSDVYVNPGAEEVCNDIDDDCDGEIDPDWIADASQWYIDYDGDGWGFYDVATNVEACDQPVGYSAELGDCDNNDPSVNPGTADGCVCDGYDGVCVTCGDGVLDSGEECDGSDLGGQDCQSQGYAGGSLSCSATCVLDTGFCNSGGGGGGGGGTTSES